MVINHLLTGMILQVLHSISISRKFPPPDPLKYRSIESTRDTQIFFHWEADSLHGWI